MAILVRTCCCGCSLKTGIAIIAILGVLEGGFGIYSGVSEVQKHRDLEDEIRELDKEGIKLPISYKHYKVVIILDYANIVLSGLVTFTCILLMASYGEGNSNCLLVLPYLVLHIFLLPYILGLMIFFISILDEFEKEFVFFVTIAALLLSLYFNVVVYSYYESLRQDQSEPVADNDPPMPMVVQVAGPPQYQKYP